MAHRSCGAVVTFTGTTRARNRERDVERLDYEAFERMSGPEMARIFEITRTPDCAEGVEAFLEKRAPVYHPGAPVDKRAVWHEE